MSQDDLQREPAETPEEELSVGDRLRAAREAQPLSLAQIATELRIELEYLAALEEDRLDDFPAPVFAKGYLKQYGGLLGLDERDLLAQYYRQVEVRDVPVIKHKPIKLRDDSQIRHWIAAGLVLALIVGGFVAWWLARPEVEPVSVEGAAEPLPEPPPVVVPDEPAEPAAATPLPTPRTVGEPEADPVLVGPPPDASTAGAPEQAAAATVQVELSFVEDCWTEISDARGERLFYGLGSAGARSRFSARLPISIFLGNAAGVELTVNGEPYPIPAESRQGNLARFVIADPGI